MPGIPRLSVCIPTFQRPDLLEACLATVLPQTQPFGDEVECVISDNASADETEAVITRYAEQFPLRHFRNDTNIGILGNITKVVTERARGEYVLLIGDDDTLIAGAVERIVNQLREEPAPAMVALNVGFLPQDSRPSPAELRGGVRLAPAHCLRAGMPSGRYSFEQLLTGPCADFTASYSVILRRQAWLDAFPTPYLDPPFTCVRDTYPHAFIIATSLTGCRACFIAEPSIMVFEMPAEQFSWSRYRAVNSLVHATGLLHLYEKHGVSRRTLIPFYRYQLEHRALFLGDLIWDRDCVGGWKEVLRFAWMEKRFPFLLLKAFAVAMCHRNAPPWAKRPVQWLQRCKQIFSGT